MQNKNQQITALTELNENLENYFSNTIIPQLFVDAQLILRKFTPPAQTKFKLKEEFVGLPLKDISENFRYPTIIENIKTVIATGKILEKEIQTTNMEWYQMNILPYLAHKEDKANGVIITFIDITPRIRDLKEQERQIAEYELLLDTIAHDINNPLLGLNLTIQVLKQLPVKNMEKFSSLINNLEHSVTNIGIIINDLLKSRWQNQRYQAAIELLDLQNVIEDVRLTLAPQILESGANIIQDVQRSQVRFVRRKLRSVIYNLVSNAIKYTPSGRIPEIIIKSYEENEYVVISVADNGIGMSKEDRKSIFAKFKRVKLDVEGSGVGLYLVHTIVVGTGGKITIQSTPNHGSVFKVYLKME
jgi:two-component system phosphate regulon sensor histidine kinase PhoR